MLLALRSPNLVRGLLLVNTVGRPRPDRRIEMFRRLGGDEAAEAARRDIEAHSPETKDTYFRLCMPLMTQRPYSSDELARLTPPAPGVFDRLVELSHESTDLLPAVGAIGCPTLVITGEYDPAATPEDAVDLRGGHRPQRPLARRAGCRPWGLPRQSRRLPTRSQRVPQRTRGADRPPLVAPLPAGGVGHTSDSQHACPLTGRVSQGLHQPRRRSCRCRPD